MIYYPDRGEAGGLNASEGTGRLGRLLLLEHHVRDLGEHAALRAHEPDLPELHAQPAVAALQVAPLLGDLLAFRAPQPRLLPELEKLGAPDAHLQRGDHALLHVVRREELPEDALVAARARAGRRSGPPPPGKTPLRPCPAPGTRRRARPRGAGSP